ncbi:MAG TPA: maleylpyruvate isomerase N-terminal domain-containing protein [Actinomycetota bacterium]|nr:maleylpyruvate isomerase N-terminal domain-containing protein [Actinomycetota bacterium]
MDKAGLQNSISEVHGAWQAVIDELGPQGLERPGATGDWRVRDVLAHFNCWERWQLVQLRCAFTGETPTDEELHGGLTFPPNDDMAEDAMNAMFYAANVDRPLDDVVADWREVSSMRADWVAAAPPPQLNAIIGQDWTGGTNRIFRLASEVPAVSGPEPVWARILDQVRHQEQHLEQVREWMGG